MKKKILLGTIISICIIMLVNTVSAVEYNTVTDYNIDLLELHLDNIYNFIEKIQQTFENLNFHSIDINYRSEIKELSNELSELKISILGDSSLPLFIRTILGFIIGLIFSIIGTIFGIIFGPLLALFVRIITAPAVLLAKLIAFIVNLLAP